MRRFELLPELRRGLAGGVVSCRICRQEFEGIVACIEHSQAAHEPKVTTEIRHVLLAMSSRVLPTDVELMMDVTLRSDLLVRNVSSRYEGTATKLVAASIYPDFLLELLGAGAQQPHVTPKIFERPTVVQVRIPAWVPLEFTTESVGRTAIGCSHLRGVEAKALEAVVHGVFQAFADREMLVLQAHELASSFSVEECSQLAVKFVILKTEDTIGVGGGCSFKMYAMRREAAAWDDDTEFHELRTAVEQLYGSRRTGRCKRCRRVIPMAEESAPCRGLVIGTISIDRTGACGGQPVAVTHDLVEETSRIDCERRFGRDVGLAD